MIRTNARRVITGVAGKLISRKRDAVMKFVSNACSYVPLAIEVKEPISLLTPTCKPQPAVARFIYSLPKYVSSVCFLE